jgi:polar amino acid transport system substrate-binding protein
MVQKWVITALSLAFTVALPAASYAETVMEKVARTGVLTVGSRLDTVPYSYFNDQQEWVGYSVDVLTLLKEDLEKQIGKPLTVQVIEEEEFSEGSRIQQLQTGEIDIACPAQFTWERDRFVDFSMPFSISGIRLMSPQDSQLGSPQSLVGKRIGIAEGSIAGQAVKLVQPQATLVSFKRLEDIVEALKQGKVDAVAGDTVIMAGLRPVLGLTDYQITPDEPYARYGLACMVPQNNPAFLRLVNHSIVKLMQGYVVGEKRYVEMVSRWFGPTGIIEAIDPELVRDFFQVMLTTAEQIPPEELQAPSGDQTSTSPR